MTLVPQLEEMVKLYRGEFLQYFYVEDSTDIEDWILVQRESLRQQVMNALTYLANEYERRGDFPAAQCYALDQLKLDPWREEAHYQIMHMLALKGERSAALAQYETCKKVLAEELGVEPSPKTRDLYEQIRLGALKAKNEIPTHIPTVPIHNLPVALTPFIGRDQELAKLDQMIADPECRCITLVGPGGMGKTRLALQAADQHRNTFTDGVAFIPLASVASVESVIPDIANEIGFDIYGPTDPKIQLLHHLREKQMLLVVDNAEHLLVEDPHRGTIADLLIEILQEAGQIKLLVTSRESLHLQGEWPIEVDGLDFPTAEQRDAVEDYGAVALFVQRAQRARPGFEINEEDKTSIARLCRLVEGMPLAIELAATWVRLLSPAEIATEIEQSLDFLNAQIRDLPERHRNMRAVFDHSWQMLSTEEKAVLGRLSVFRGGFQRKAAEQVAGASLSVLSSLVMRSLLRRTVSGRYDLHELIRQYAASKLAEDPGELRSAQEQHSHYFVSMLEEKKANLRSKHQKQTLAELTAEMDNIRAALDWSIADQKFIPLNRVSVTLWYVFELHNWWMDGEVTFWNTAEALQACRETDPNDTVYPVALNVMLAHCAYFKFRQGRSEEAYSTLVSSAGFLQTSVDPSFAIYPLCYLGIGCWEQGRFAEATDNLQQSLELARKFGERWFEAASNEFLGIVLHEKGEYLQARQHLSEALAIGRQLGDPLLIAHVLSYLGRTTRMLGDFSESEKLLRESVAVAREIGYRSGIGLALDALGLVMSAQGRTDEAMALFSESGSLFREVGDTYRQSRVLNHQGLNYLALNQIVKAQNAFNAALRIAYEGGYIPTALDALSGAAALETRWKANQGTFELVLYILQHPVSTQEAKNLAAQLRVELESKLPQEELEAAQQRARSKSLDEFVWQVLAST